jgi:CBS domain containing-hemolysin-like protein
LVTIEDILEEIVGEIQDEYDVEQPLVERLSDRELLADGRLPLDEVAEALGIPAIDDDEGTVAGFVHRHLGRLPEEGDEFTADGLHIKVVAVEGRRVRQLRVSRGDDAGEQGPSQPSDAERTDPVPPDSGNAEPPRA